MSTPDDAQAWSRVHPLTPLLRSGAVFVAIVAVLISQAVQILQRAAEDLFAQEETKEAQDGLDFLGSHPLLILAAVGAAVVFFAVVGLVNWISWKMIGYRTDESAIYFKQGLLFKQQRSARLDRVQAIDIEQPVFARLLGLAALKFDAAGGDASSVRVAYLKRREAEALRDSMLERVRAAKAGVAPHTGTPAPPPEAANPNLGGEAGKLADPRALNGQVRDAPGSAAGSHPRLAEPASDSTAQQAELSARAHRPGAPRGLRIVEQLSSMGSTVAHDLSDTVNEVLAPYSVRGTVDPSGRIIRVRAHTVILSTLLSTVTIVLALLVLGMIVTGVILAANGRVSAGVSLLTAGVFAVAAPLVAVVKSSFDLANFSVALSADGLVVTRGLLSTTRRVIPIDRIQAVRLSQPLLWRSAGWWRIVFNTAGSASSSSIDQARDSVLLPVGTLDDALALLGLVLPDPGVQAVPDDAQPGDAQPGEDQPGDARPVTGGDVLRQAMLSSRSGAAVNHAAGLFNHQPASSRLLDPISYRSNSRLVTSTMTVVRYGVLTRGVECVPHARVQSLSLNQGPLQRALKLATVRLDSTAGPVRPRIRHLAVTDAQRFLFELSATTREARRQMDRAVRK